MDGNNISIPFPDGTTITMKLVREDGNIQVYDWMHVSFDHIIAVTQEISQRVARVEIMMVDERFHKATYFCENPVCEHPEHDFTEQVNHILQAARAEPNLTNTAAAFTGAWIQLNLRALQMTQDIRGMIGDIRSLLGA